MMKLTTWRKNLKRWSVQLAMVGAALGGLEGAAHAVEAAQATLPLWKPVLPPWGFATVTLVLNILIAWVRNLPQKGVE